MIGMRALWLRISLILSLLIPVWFLVAALGAKFHILDWRIAFGVMVVGLGALLLLVLFVVGLVGLIMALAMKPRVGWRGALVATLIPFLGLAYAGVIISGARAIPPVHDISTDITDPPAFGADVIAARAALPGGNAVESMTQPISTLASYRAMPNPAIAGESVGALGRRANPDLVSLPLTLAVGPATQAAATAAHGLGWQVARVDPEAGRVEATVESFWFGFKDDIVVRIRPAGAGSTLDIRSTSRVGVSDLGANAKRIRAFLTAMRAAH